MAKKKAAKKKATRKASKKASKKAPAKKAPTSRRATPKLNDLDKKTIGVIARTATGVHNKIIKENLPELKFPVRSLSNVSYTKSTGFFELGKGRKVRALTVNTVKSFAQTLRLMSLSKEMVENDNFATKREAYYISKNWNDAKFNQQPESDAVMDDIEALASLEGLTREQLRYRPEEHGGALAGALTVIDRDRTTGDEIRIDCTAMGTGAYTIPSSVEHLKFETKAKFILAIETGGMFHRLNDHQYWRQANCILISMGGVPSRAQRRFMRRLSEEHKLPTYCFVDCDPYGIANIYRTLKVGSGNAAPHQPLLLRAQGPVFGGHPPGHCGLQTPGRHPPPQGRGHQAGQGRPQKRPLLPSPPPLEKGAQPNAENGRARRAAGPGEMGPQLRARGIPAPQTQKQEVVPALNRTAANTPLTGGKSPATPRESPLGPPSPAQSRRIGRF